MRRPFWLRVRAALLIVASAFRLAGLATMTLPELITRLREDRRRPLRGALADPTLLAAGVNRLLPLLQHLQRPRPHRFGPCLQRSLLLVDLLGRCGEAPTLHCGLRRIERGAVEGHAWITIDGRFFAGQPALTDGYVETWRA